MSTSLEAMSKKAVLFFYYELRRRELVRISQTNPFADRLVRKVLEHPDFLTLIQPKLEAKFTSRRERTQWLLALNATNPFRWKLTSRHIDAYYHWLAAGQPGHQAPLIEMLTSIGAGDKGSGGRKRAIRTPSSLELARTHGLRVGNRVVPLILLHRIVEQAPEQDRPLLRRLCGGLAQQLPEQPDQELFKAVEHLVKRLPKSYWDGIY